MCSNKTYNFTIRTKYKNGTKKEESFNVSFNTAKDWYRDYKLESKDDPNIEDIELICLDSIDI